MHTISPAMIFLTVCDQPIRSSPGLKNYWAHFKGRHPHMKKPQKSRFDNFFSKKRPIKQETHETVCSTNKAEAHDDVVILYGYGRVMKWRWPDGLKRCPVLRCSDNSDNRAELIRHYRDTHADYSTLCELCNKPFSVQDPINFQRHYISKHPNVAVPLSGAAKYDHQSHRKVKKTNLIDTEQAAAQSNKRIQPDSTNRHTKEMHSARRISCPLKLCSYEATQMNEMRSHWSSEHQGREFPEFRDASYFTFTQNGTDNRDSDKKKVLKIMTRL